MLDNILAHAGEAGAGGGQFPAIHPIFVNFTAALLPTSLAADLLARIFRRESLRATGWWTLLLAALVTPLTGVAGWMWMRSMEDMDHWQMPYHKWIGVGLAAGFVLLAAWRGWLYRRNRAPTVSYFIAGALLLGLLGFQGELGGSMSFGHAILISDEQPHASHNSSQANPTGDDHSSTGHPPLPDGWKDHIEVSDAPATRP